MKVHPKYIKQGVIQNANPPIVFLFADAFLPFGNYRYVCKATAIYTFLSVFSFCFSFLEEPSYTHYIVQTLALAKKGNSAGIRVGSVANGAM